MQYKVFVLSKPDLNKEVTLGSEAGEWMLQTQVRKL